MSTIGIIPAAGRGLRLGLTLPKPLVLLGRQRLIEYAIDNIIFSGVSTVVIVVPPGERERFDSLIKNTYDTENYTFIFVEQEKPRGIAEAVKLAFDVVPDADYGLVHLGDEFNIEPGLGNIGADLLDVLRDKEAYVTEAYHEEEDREIIQHTNELWVDDNGRIIEIIEKPDMVTSNMRGIGIYAFDRDIFDTIYEVMEPSPVRGEKEITDIVRHCAHLGKAYAVYFDGVCVNINTPKDLQYAEGVACCADQK